MTHPAEEMQARHVRRDGASVAVLRVVQSGEAVVVEAEVFPQPGRMPARPGPYTFASAREAGAFVTDAVEALIYLGCDVADA